MISDIDNPAYCALLPFIGNYGQQPETEIMNAFDAFCLKVNIDVIREAAHYLIENGETSTVVQVLVEKLKIIVDERIHPRIESVITKGKPIEKRVLWQPALSRLFNRASDVSACLLAMPLLGFPSVDWPLVAKCHHMIASHPGMRCREFISSLKCQLDLIALCSSSFQPCLEKTTPMPDRPKLKVSEAWPWPQSEKQLVIVVEHLAPLVKRAPRTIREWSVTDQWKTQSIVQNDARKIVVAKSKVIYTLAKFRLLK